eukprot:CAMPEP_0177791322 /NCGR_PEP_ID=MMETSP0491_2-20121128/23863_1 /TAXON_ID=63592 /ORGANISM="Tetraselmis chuii, Strain PLY429" /LENGTH=326 /DNA_ID=CAMNT_0019313529 /DNA_START=1 /DNA_END=981 /DNA_ORIENTATION=+
MLQTRMDAVERKLQQLCSAVTQLANASQTMGGQAAQASDVEALRDWVAEELTKLRGQGKATHAACMECVQRADGAGKALARMHEAAAVEQREEGMMRQQELMQQLDQQGHRLRVEMERSVRHSVHEALQQDAKWEQRLQALARGHEQLKDDLNRLRGEVRAPGMMSNGKPAAFAPHPPPTKFLHKQEDGVVWTSRYRTHPEPPPQPASKMNVAGARLKLPKVKPEAGTEFSQSVRQGELSHDLKALALRDFSVPHISSYLQGVSSSKDGTHGGPTAATAAAAASTAGTGQPPPTKLGSDVVNGKRVGAVGQPGKAAVRQSDRRWGR